MKGRKAKLRVYEGSAAPKEAPAAPAWLSPHAQAEWERVAPDLFARKVLGADTMATLESYCIAVGLVRETEGAMQAEGRTVEGQRGLQPHPAFKIQASAMREARLLAGELGLTPHRRPPVEDEGKDDGEFSGLLA